MNGRIVFITGATSGINAHGIDPIQDGNLEDWGARMDINVGFYCRKRSLSERKRLLPLNRTKENSVSTNQGFKEVTLIPNGKGVAVCISRNNSGNDRTKIRSYY